MNKQFAYIIFKSVERGLPTFTAKKNYIKELFCWAFASYDSKNNLYKVNIRSRGPIINEVANRYNGGGHKLDMPGSQPSPVNSCDHDEQNTNRLYLHQLCFHFVLLEN